MAKTLTWKQKLALKKAQLASALKRKRQQGKRLVRKAYNKVTGRKVVTGGRGGKRGPTTKTGKALRNIRTNAANAKSLTNAYRILASNNFKAADKVRNDYRKMARLERAAKSTSKRAEKVYAAAGSALATADKLKGKLEKKYGGKLSTVKRKLTMKYRAKKAKLTVKAGMRKRDAQAAFKVVKAGAGVAKTRGANLATNIANTYRVHFKTAQGFIEGGKPGAVAAYAKSSIIAGLEFAKGRLNRQTKERVLREAVAAYKKRRK